MGLFSISDPCRPERDAVRLAPDAVPWKESRKRGEYGEQGENQSGRKGKMARAGFQLKRTQRRTIRMGVAGRHPRGGGTVPLLHRAPVSAISCWGSTENDSASVIFFFRLPTRKRRHVHAEGNERIVRIYPERSWPRQPYSARRNAHKSRALLPPPTVLRRRRLRGVGLSVQVPNLDCDIL